MKLSYNWLSEYLPKPLSLSELTEILTKVGLEVEASEKIEKVRGGLEGLLIGRVLACGPHPNADQLSLTTVELGEGRQLSIVCGAPNVAEGQKVVVAPVGTTIYPLEGGEMQIKKAKIRGQHSEGMICGESEIGLGEDRSGIIVLPDTAVVGMPAKDYFKLPEPDYRIEIGLTPNRSDANSHLGVAKDLCTYLSYHEQKDYQVRFPDSTLPEPAASRPFQIRVIDQDACRRYAGLSLEGVKIGPSPQWLRDRLLAIGVQPINNVVDCTNYVLHEYGQPLHAFDYDKIAGQTIVIQKARAAQRFRTLDDQERTLSEEDLLICDAEKPMVIAGVFGGAHSGICEETTNVFLESAYFDAESTRKTSLRHQLRTEAATHFEKGVAMDAVIPALKRAATLILETAGGRRASEIVDEYPKPFEPREITLRFSYLNKLCGKDYEPGKVAQVLTSLGFAVCDEQAESITVRVPGENRDIHQPADLVEEILRIDGLDNVAIPDKMTIPLQQKKIETNRRLRERISAYLSAVGFHEVITNSLTNSRYYPDRTDLVRLLNSISVELDVLRPSMLESGLEVIRYNTNRKMPDLKLYEFGKTYRQQAPGKYEEEEILAFWISGLWQEGSWKEEKLVATEYELKGAMESVLQLAAGGKQPKCSVEDGEMLWKNGSEVVARAGVVPAEKRKMMDIKQVVYYGEIRLAKLRANAGGKPFRFQELPKYPAIERDLALVVDKPVRFEQIHSVLRKKQWPALKSYHLFDVFENEKLGTDKKSLALNLTFQLNERTLTDKEVDKMMNELIDSYVNELNAQVRS